MTLGNQKLIRNDSSLETNTYYVKMLSFDVLLHFVSLTYTLFSECFTTEKDNIMDVSLIKYSLSKDTWCRTFTLNSMFVHRKKVENGYQSPTYLKLRILKKKTITL